MIRRFAALGLAMLMAACASKPAVQTDFDTNAKFGAYRTYSWIADPGALVPKSIVDGIDTRLQARGWKPAAKGEVHVAAHVTTREGENYNKFYSGIGHDLNWLGVGHGVPDSVTMSVDTYEVGTLVVDMFDAGTQRAVWRSSASGVLPDDPARRNAAVQATLDQMFAKFPPGGQPAR
ncbi:MAG: DUF4136 domain-containing protein [Variovorax sp.]|nr:MAG: DUF4136 domain-containing protein [Variovorax sp.]